MTHSRDERLALADLLEQKGPDAPTLCAGWTTGDLAAHLVLRESRPDAAAGVMGGPLAGYTARAQQRLKSRMSYQELIAAFRNGPPRFSAFALPRLDEAANTVEYFVHHEDVRRGDGDRTPRELDPRLAEALWGRLKGGARFFVRSAPVGVELARDEGSAGGTGAGAGPFRVTAKRTAPLVTVSGSPAELTLWAFGRVTASHVEFDGPKAAINQLQAWRRLPEAPGGSPLPRCPGGS
ncbi:MAG TPA: TIGR03085 family metal-binding protein [Trebonia sp.]|nr:TIGR03085 family metal-binding protein [Trebonia sp.]